MTWNMGNEVNTQITLNSLGWETLKVQRTKAKAKLMFKILNKSGSKRLTDLFSYKNENIHITVSVTMTVGVRVHELDVSVGG